MACRYLDNGEGERRLATSGFGKVSPWSISPMACLSTSAWEKTTATLCCAETPIISLFRYPNAGQTCRFVNYYVAVPAKNACKAQAGISRAWSNVKSPSWSPLDLTQHNRKSLVLDLRYMGKLNGLIGVCWA